MQARYQCLKCGHKFKDKPGPTVCPMCYNQYIKWVNYKEWYDQSEVKKFDEN